MAQKIQIVLEDDLDGGPADETVLFAFDGVGYEIDLSRANAAKLRESLAPYVGHARKTSSRGARSSRSRSPRGTSDAAAIREWARANGQAVNERGRVSAEIRQAYENR